MGLINITNELVVKNVEKTILFYKENFDFKCDDYIQEDKKYTWAKISNNNVSMMIYDYETCIKETFVFPKELNSNQIICFKYSSINECEKMYFKFKNSNLKIFKQLYITDYGTMEFGLQDLDNNVIIISCEN